MTQSSDSKKRRRAGIRPLAVGEKLELALSRDELVDVMARHLCEREGIEGRIRPTARITFLGREILSIDVTIERMG